MPLVRKETVYQLVLDAEGKLVDVTRKRAAVPPRRYPAYGATVFYTSKGVPLHVCYDQERENAGDDRRFCRKERTRG